MGAAALRSTVLGPGQAWHGETALEKSRPGLTMIDGRE
jgi:hypothetical protein